MANWAPGVGVVNGDISDSCSLRNKKKKERKPDEIKGEKKETYIDLQLRSSLSLFYTHLTRAINSKRWFNDDIGG